MNKKIIKILSIFAVAFAALGFNQTTSSTVNAEESVGMIYVSTNGLDTNVGTKTAPFQTMDKALAEVADGGTIVIQNSASLRGWPKYNKAYSITGGTLEMLWSSDIVIDDSVTFYDVNLSVNSAVNVYANGNEVTIGEDVVWTGSPAIQLHGGGMSGTTVSSTDLTVLSGTYNGIFGGSKCGTVLGDTNLFVGGTVNADIDETNHKLSIYVFGGGNEDTIHGNTNVTFGGNAKVVYLYGGSNKAQNESQGDPKIGGHTNLNIVGGKGMSAYGGNRLFDCGLGANFTMSGGTFEQVFGANERAAMSGDVDMRLTGGTITRRVYAGCYNDYGVFSGWESTHSVSGKLNLELGGDVNISFTSSEMDKGIYARSRYNKDVETSQLVFTSEFAYSKYKNKLGGDYSGSYFNISAADEVHYYHYAKSGNVITQTCAYHDTHSATATFVLDDGFVAEYHGEAVEPASIAYSDNWEYDKPDIIYQNNDRGGVATGSLVIGGEVIDGEFSIIEAPTILGGSVRLSTPAGLRFQSKVSKGMLELGATFGTLIIPRAVLGKNELTVDTAMVENVKQTTWATDIMKENNPAAYEEGYEYFNAVLTHIPAEHYGTEIVARSYAYIDGVYYYSEEIERSIAQVAAFAIQDGYTNDVLYDYVDIALADETPSVEGEVILGENGTYQLTLSGVRGYVAVWTVEDDSIISIGKNGQIIALAEGQTYITAKIGSTILHCTVIVRKDIEDSDNELPLVPYD